MRIGVCVMRFVNVLENLQTCTAICKCVDNTLTGPQLTCALSSTSVVVEICSSLSSYTS